MNKTSHQKQVVAELRPVRIAADALIDELQQIASLTYHGVAAITPAGRFYNADRIREAAGQITGRVRLRVGGVILELGEHRTRILIDPKHASGDDEAIAERIVAFVRRHQVSVLPSVAVEVLLVLFMGAMVLAIFADGQPFQSVLMVSATIAVVASAAITLLEAQFRRAGMRRVQRA